MRIFLIEPRDPLIARDGRPSALGRFESLPFPLPSTIAGSARTRMASDDGAFSLSASEAQKLLGLAVHGPLLAEVASAGEKVARFFAPAPRDAVLFPPPGAAPEQAACHRLAPVALPAGCTVDALSELDLLPVSFSGAAIGYGAKEKPLSSPPGFWSWEVFERWLAAPESPSALDLAADCLGGLPRERRVHLSIEPGERVGVEGALFETEGLRFLAGPQDSLAPRRLALSMSAEEDPEGARTGFRLALREELAPLGGERRLARWRESEAPWPPLPAAVREGIVAGRRARLVLLTPAAFARGALPGWNGGAVPELPGVTVKVCAACVPRAVVVSGWDLATQRPKPSRRLAPAGSVYFVELGGSEEAIGAWCEKVWLQPVSDDGQARRDGFGLAALGVWPEEEA